MKRSEYGNKDNEGHDEMEEKIRNGSAQLIADAEYAHGRRQVSGFTEGHEVRLFEWLFSNGDWYCTKFIVIDGKGMKKMQRLVNKALNNAKTNERI